MYRHVARLHFDLVQLWRCPIAWCTTWKGSPQDCLEHVRSGHDAPWVSKTASIEKYAPPWTVRRQLWTDSLRIEHSGISTDMLLFSEVGMPLTQHYRVYKGGLPHAVFRTDYLTRLRSLLPSPRGADTSPDDQCGVTPTSVRRPHRLSRPKRLFPDSVPVGAPILTEQNPVNRGDCDRLPSASTPSVDSVERYEPADDFRCAGLCFIFPLRRDSPVDYEYGHK